MKKLFPISVEVRVIIIVGLAAFLVGLANRRGFFTGGAPAPAIPMPPDVPRLSWQHVDSVDIGFADDVTRLEDVLYVLDQRQARVAMIQVGESGPAYLGAFGRSGGGPGEFESAFDVSTNGRSVVVLERSGRLSDFDRRGSFLGSVNLKFPCQAMGGIELAFLGADTLLAGRCADPRFSGDTVFAGLYRASTGLAAAPLMKIPLHTLRGDWGTAFAAEQYLSYGMQVAAFGTGTEDCMWTASVSGNSASTICGIGGMRIDVPQSARDREVIRGLQERSPSGYKIYEWPRPFPAYTSKFVSGEDIGLVRLATTDTVFLSWLSEPARPILVAPTEHFVGCGFGICLWLEAVESGARIAAYCPKRGKAIAQWACRSDYSQVEVRQ